MAKLGFIDFEKVKSSITIEQVLAAYGVNDLKSAGDQLRGRCPLHDGSNDRHRQFTDGAYQRVVLGAQMVANFADVSGGTAAFLQILTGAERAPGSGQYNSANAVVLARGL